MAHHYGTYLQVPPSDPAAFYRIRKQHNNYMQNMHHLYIIITITCENCIATPRMTPPLWSKQGCWTCRLRKKKCDEGHPQCSACESLSITCHGYGSKPDWMDGGDDERAVANGIKEIVKQTSRRKTAQSIKQRDPPKIAPKSTSLSESSSSPLPSHDVSRCFPILGLQNNVNLEA